MVFNNDVIFIHIGKTGGMSCADYLLHNLQAPVYNCHHEVIAETERLGIAGTIAKPDIHRHCTLAETLDYICQFNGKELSDFSKVIAVIRHPFTLEYSFYKHLQKPEVQERRKKNPDLIKLANGDFKTFVEQGPYHRKDHTQDDFFRLNNQIPDNVELVRFEQLAEAFPMAVSPFVKNDEEYLFPHRNRTDYQSSICEELTDEVRELIYHKHKYLFDSGLYSTNM